MSDKVDYVLVNSSIRYNLRPIAQNALHIMINKFQKNSQADLELF